MPPILPLEPAVISAIADERRAFIARYLLDNTPRGHFQLLMKLQDSFPKVAGALHPWPERSQSIADICFRSLSTTGLVDVKPITVEGPKGRDEMANGFYATPRAAEISDVIDFAFGVANKQDLSLFGVLGYMVGGSLTSIQNRANLILRLAEETKPGKPVSLASISLYNGYNGHMLAAHAQALAKLGLVTVTSGVTFEDGERKRYYWASKKSPSPELARKVRGRYHPKFAILMNILCTSTSRDGKTAMHHFDIAEQSGYSPDKVTITLKMLENAGIVRSVTTYSSIELSVTEPGVNVAEQLLRPIHLCFNGSEPSEKSRAWAEIKQVGRDFRQTGSEGLGMLMARYVQVAGTAYAK